MWRPAQQPVLRGAVLGGTSYVYPDMLPASSGGFMITAKFLSHFVDEELQLLTEVRMPEVTDDLLANAFRKYKSFQKAKIIRDKRFAPCRCTCERYCFNLFYTSFLIC